MDGRHRWCSSSRSSPNGILHVESQTAYKRRGQRPTAQVTDAQEHGPSTGLRTIDCDVHPHLPKGLRTLGPYLPVEWRRRLLGGVSDTSWATEVYASQLSLPKNDMYINPVGSMR